MLMRATKWSDGRVVAIDELGRQITDLQGHIDSAGPKVLRAAEPTTRFFVGDTLTGATREITRDEFYTPTYDAPEPAVDDTETRRDDDSSDLLGAATAIAVDSLLSDTSPSFDSGSVDSGGGDTQFDSGGGDFGGGGSDGSW